MTGAGLLTVLLAACGSNATEPSSASATARSHKYVSPLQRKDLNVTLDEWEGPASVGFVMAERRNYLAEVGLNVEVLVPGSPVNSILYVINGTDDLGVSHAPQIVLAKERGAPIVMIGSLVPQPTAAMIWLKSSGIRDIADLKGKTIATPGLRYQRSFLERVLARGGLTLDDVMVKNVGLKLAPALIGGHADATFGGSWNLEAPELEARGLKPVVTHVEDLGFPRYEELVLFARADRVSSEPQVFRDLMTALARGTAAAIEDPKGAAIQTNSEVESNPAASLEELEAGIAATLPLLSRTGRVSPSRTARLVDWMFEEGMIDRKLPVSALLADVDKEPGR